MAINKYDDIESQADRDRRRMKFRLAMIMTLVTLIGFVLLLIWSGGSSGVQTDGVVVNEESGEEIVDIYSMPDDKRTLDEFMYDTFRDDDGGYWVIEAFPVPEEWRR